MSTTPTVVLVHGAFADASGYDGVIRRLQAEGLAVRAPMNPLRGLAFDADAIARYTTSIEGQVLLVGHSYGGAVVSQAARSRSARPDRRCGPGPPGQRRASWPACYRLSLIRNDRAISTRGRSEVFTNSTASRRNSGGYLDGRLTQGSVLWPHARIRCPPKRVEVNRLGRAG